MDPIVDMTVRVGLAALFAAAAVHKVRAPAFFRSTLLAYRIMPAALVPIVARAVPATEAAAALLLVGRRVPGLVGAAALLAVYALAVGLNVARGRRDLDCGCAGPAARRPISGWLVARNASLAAVALVVATPVHARVLTWLDSVTGIGTLLAFTAAYAATDRLLAQAPAFARLRGA
jgi:hypothetical protein